MFALFAHHAPMIGLLFFFIVFLAIAAWAYNPRRKKEFEALGNIPLQEDEYGRT